MQAAGTELAWSRSASFADAGMALHARVTGHAEAVTRILGAVAACVLLAGVAVQAVRLEQGEEAVLEMVHLLALDAEYNIPTWFSVVLMLWSAALLAFATAAVYRRRGPFLAKWATLCAGFVLMACDEAFQYHEMLIGPFRALLGGEHFGIFFFAWVIPGSVLVVLLALYFRRFLLHLPAPTAVRFAAAGAVFVAGAIGLELAGGWYAEAHGFHNWPYSILMMAEEALEIAGLILFIRALQTYLGQSAARGPSAAPAGAPAAA